jgi:hypothetical protein
MEMNVTKEAGSAVQIPVLNLSHGGWLSFHMKALSYKD